MVLRALILAVFNLVLLLENLFFCALQDVFFGIGIGVPLQRIATVSLLDELRLRLLCLLLERDSVVAHGLVFVLQGAVAQIEVVDLDDVLLVYVHLLIRGRLGIFELCLAQHHLARRLSHVDLRLGLQRRAALVRLPLLRWGKASTACRIHGGLSLLDDLACSSILPDLFWRQSRLGAVPSRERAKEVHSLHLRSLAFIPHRGLRALKARP